MDAVSVDQAKVPTDSDIDALLQDKELMIDPYNEDEVINLAQCKYTTQVGTIGFYP